MGELLNYLRIILGAVYVLLLPGLLLTLIVFSDNLKKQLDLVERLILSFIFSITSVPLAVYLGWLIGFKITALNIFLEILFLLWILLLIILLQKNAWLQNKLLYFKNKFKKA